MRQVLNDNAKMIARGRDQMVVAVVPEDISRNKNV